MKIKWQVTKADVYKAQRFYERHGDNPFVKNRISRNVKKSNHRITKARFWERMIACLLTTQQRSGPESNIYKFIHTKPFPLALENCRTKRKLENFVCNTIKKSRGIRRANRIADEVSANFIWLEDGGWKLILNLIKSLNNIKDKEREVAEFINDNLKGFGPKQARNLLQSLGLTKYEIPIDSRIIKWLNDFDFPIRLTSAGLADRNYYNFIQDGFQKLCEKCGIYPCVLDAVIFSSFDYEWSDNGLIDR